MSIPVSQLVWNSRETITPDGLRRLQPADKLVLLQIADNCNHDGICVYCSLERITRETALDKRNVMRILLRLEEAGVISRRRTRGGAHSDKTGYTINLAVFVLWKNYDYQGRHAPPTRGATPPLPGAPRPPLPYLTKSNPGPLSNSLSPIVDPVADGNGAGGGERDKQNPKAPLREKPKTPGPGGPSIPESRRLFDRVMLSYPKPVKLNRAFRQWKRLNPSELLTAAILEDLALRVTFRQWTQDGGRYIPTLARYLEEKLWEDWDTRTTDPPPKLRAYLEEMRRNGETSEG